MQTVLYITNSGTQYWRKAGPVWQPCDGLQSGALWVVTNLAEEGLSEVQVPRLFGSDRQNFIQRQLTSRFPDTPYTLALAQPASGSLMERLAPPRQTLFGLDAAQRVNAALDDVASAPVAGVWASSLLLVQLGSHKSLPKELFVVLPGPDGLRIVFVKNRLPVLSRLVPGVTQAADVAAEITRTVRYLENNHLLARSTDAHHVLLLDNQPGIDPLLAQERLTRVPAPPPWRKNPPVDWRFAFFDLAIKSPAGQMAPLVRRTQFVANRLRTFIYAAVGVCVAAAVWLAAANLKDISNGYASRAQTQQRIDLLSDQSRGVAQDVSRFGVSPELVRTAVQLAQDELATAPSLAAQLHQLAGAISAFDPLRLRQLNWHLLAAAEVACSTAAAIAPAAAPAAPDTAVPKHRVEVSLEVLWPDGQGERARAQGIANLSAKLAALAGASLITDPASALALSPFSGGAGASAASTQALTWCLTLPEAAPAAATEIREP